MDGNKDATSPTCGSLVDGNTVVASRAVGGAKPRSPDGELR